MAHSRPPMTGAATTLLFWLTRASPVSLSLDHETRFDRNVEPLEWFPDRATQPSAEVTGSGCVSATVLALISTTLR